MTAIKIKYEHVYNNEELKTLVHPSFYQENINVNGCIMSKNYSKIVEKILDFEVRDDDIFVISFPKSGTTWAQEMVWCIANDMNLEKSKQISILARFPCIETYSNLSETIIQSVDTDKREKIRNTVENLRSLQGKRFIKTHLPLHLLPGQLQSKQRKAKVVYVARDPRDVCVSYYHYRRTFSGYTCDFSTFIRLFLDNKLPYTPYWQQVLGYWNIRHEPNVLFVRYEEMKRDLPAVIDRVATFLNKTLSPEQVMTLAEHLSFDSMKNNSAVNYEEYEYLLKSIHGMNEGAKFIRSGKSGVFLNDMSKEEISLFNAWCREHLESTDYPLPEFEDMDKIKI